MKTGIYELHTKLKNKKISSLEITQELVKKAKTAKNNTYISLTAEQALATAKQVDQSIDANGLKSFIHGIPYTLKDLFVTKAIRTTAGSKYLYNYIPPYDGYVSKSLSSDGAVLMGKVGCDEFGMGSTNENTPYGVVLNPLNNNFVAGGSSGGSAASVAEGSSFFSIGTDTGGSIRLPANFCGLTALKPTYGRISRYGQIAYGSSLDQASPIANSSLDLACVMESLTEHDPLDSTNAPLGRMKIVEKLLKQDKNFLKEKRIGFDPSFIDACSADVKNALNKALADLKKQGVELVEVSLPHLKYSVSVYYIIATSEASTNLSRYDGIHYGHRSQLKGDLNETYVNSRSEGLGEEVKKRILLGTYSLSSGYYDAYFAKACKMRRLIANDFVQAFHQCDVIFSPVCATTAFNVGEGVKDPIQMYMNDLYTIPVNLAGLPALALPYGQDAKGLPTGFQLIGKRFCDEELLAFGHALDLAQMTLKGVTV